jgi:hypothetical protein
MDAAKRYRVDTEKIQKAVAEDFAAKRKRTTSVAKKTKAAAARGSATLRQPSSGVSLKGNYALFIACRYQFATKKSWTLLGLQPTLTEINHLHVKESAHRRASE